MNSTIDAGSAPLVVPFALRAVVVDTAAVDVDRLIAARDSNVIVPVRMQLQLLSF